MTSDEFAEALRRLAALASVMITVARGEGPGTVKGALHRPQGRMVERDVT